MGRSRGGLTTKVHKVHVLMDARGLPIKLVLTTGQTQDAKVAATRDIDEITWAVLSALKSNTSRRSSLTEALAPVDDEPLVMLVDRCLHLDEPMVYKYIRMSGAYVNCENISGRLVL